MTPMRRWARLALLRVRAQRRVQRRFTAARIGGQEAYDLWVDAMALVVALDREQKKEQPE